MQSSNFKQVAIIGSGPAGMATAMQLQRFGIDFFLFEDKEKNSLLINGWCIENYLGVCSGKSGFDLLQLFQKNIDNNKINKIKEKVINLHYKLKKEFFEIKTKSEIYNAKYVVVASGTKPKLLDIRLSSDLKPHVFYDVFPLLAENKKTIVIIGAGDAAFDNALNLAEKNKVILCNRTTKINALKMLENKVFKHRNITYLSDCKLADLVYSQVDQSIKCKFIKFNNDIFVSADYLLVSIGRLPQKDFYDEEFRVIENMLIKNNRLFLVGDVKNSIYRQVAIAVGNGIEAAMKIYHA